MDPDTIEDDKAMPMIWDINAQPLKLFLELVTQWRAVARGGGFAPSRIFFLGIDYSAADAVIRHKGYDGPGLFEDMQVMEAAALEAFASEGLA